MSSTDRDKFIASVTENHRSQGKRFKSPWNRGSSVSQSAQIERFLAAVGVNGVILAHHAGHEEVTVTPLSQRDMIEKLDGKEASATVVEVTFEPGQIDSPHRHTGPVFGYVLEGEYEHALDDEPVKIYKVGDTFYEPSGSVHRVARNLSAKTRTRLLAAILHSRDAKEVTVPGERRVEIRVPADRRAKAAPVGTVIFIICLMLQQEIHR